MQFSIIIAVLHEKSSAFSTFSPKNIHKSVMDKWIKNCYDNKMKKELSFFEKSPPKV